MAKPYPPGTRKQAKVLFVRGYSLDEIAEELGIGTVKTLYNWMKADDWDAAKPVATAEEEIARRICLLTNRENKTKDEILELDVLCKRLIGLREANAKVDAIKEAAKYAPLTAAEIDEETGQPVKKKRRQDKKKEKQLKNDISSITKEMLDEVRNKLFFAYQLLWHEKKNDPETCRFRFILKSRQIGATYYMAWEAFEDAVLTGDNQLFISASRDQAEMFKAYIIAFAKEFFDIDLSGSPIVLSKDNKPWAQLRFLSTNSKTAQSYNGHLYIDEVFWIQGWEKLWDVASGMATHDHWRITLFSTPSAKSHPAYKKWSGEEFNEHRTEKQKRDFDVSHKALKDGWLGHDLIWRHIVTVEDAQRDVESANKPNCRVKFNLVRLKLENSPDAYANKYMCEFIDDSHSVFSLDLLMSCAANSDGWADYKPELVMADGSKRINPRPFGNKPVTVGYDPSGNGGDAASIVVLSAPLDVTDKFRLLYRERHVKQSFQYQAARIRDIKNRFRIVFMGFDATGMGKPVYELIVPIYPNVSPIDYSVPTKTRLVTKGLEVMQSGRFEFDAGDRETMQSFLMIRKTTTQSGMVTFCAARTGETGHADCAFAILDAMDYEDINAAGRGSTVVFSQ